MLRHSWVVGLNRQVAGRCLSRGVVSSLSKNRCLPRRHPIADAWLVEDECEIRLRSVMGLSGSEAAASG